MQDHTTLVATLGGKPQLITFLLDLLLARGETITQVRVIYLSRYRRSRQALDQLANEFAHDQYGGVKCQLRGFPIRTGGTDLVDIRTAEEVESVRKSVHNLFGELKEDGRKIHLGLSGGRRLISFVALAAAMQYLSPVDQIWHIYASQELIELAGSGNILHAPPGSDLRLIPVPFVPWVSYIPGLSPLMKGSSQELGEASFGWLSEEERQLCSRVWERLTHRQKMVLRAFAQGYSRGEVAERLSISSATVDNHRESILEKCSLIWEAQAGYEFDLRFLQRYFAPFLTGLDSTLSGEDSENL